MIPEKSNGAAGDDAREHASDYLGAGWVPVPIAHREKGPKIPGWNARTLEGARASFDQDFPPGLPRNVGVLLGAASGDLVDVDLDCDEAIAFADLLLPSTLTFGRPSKNHRAHRLFVASFPKTEKLFDPTRRKEKESGEHATIAEIRSGAEQTVFPGSVHPSGEPIEFGDVVEPVTIEAAELRRRVEQIAAFSLLARHWPDGGRHEAQLALAGGLLADGWGDDLATELLCMVCDIAGDEDRPKRETTIRTTRERLESEQDVKGWGTLAQCFDPDVFRAVRKWIGRGDGEAVTGEKITRARLQGLAKMLKAKRREAQKDLGRLLGDVLDGMPLEGDAKRQIKRLAEEIAREFTHADPASIAEHFARSVGSVDEVREAIERAQREQSEKVETAFDRGDHVEIADRVKRALQRKGALVADEGAIYQFRARGLWEELDASELSELVQGFAGEPVKGTTGYQALRIGAADVSGALRLVTDRVCEPEYFARAPEGFAFADAFVRLTPEGLTRLPHSPEHRARAGFDFAFDPDARCDRWRDFLETTYKPDEDAEEKIALLQEFAGACLLGIATRYQRAIVLHGEGDEGKSVIAEILAGIMPRETVVAIPPQEWGNEYRLALLRGKRLNAVAELPTADIVASTAFKGVVTGDPMTARPIREAPFMFRPIAGHIFSANKLPGTRDQSRGFWRRFVVITHNRVVPKEERNRSIGREILAAETPGIVRFALEGAERLLRVGDYTIPGSSAEAVEAWRKNADPVALFLEDKCERGPDCSSEASFLYQAFRSWARDNGHRGDMAGNTFGQRMKGLGLEAVRQQAEGKRGFRYPVRFVSAPGDLVLHVGGRGV